MSETLLYEAGERIAVWTYTPGHKCLASIVEAAPACVLVETGGVKRRLRQWTTWDKLARRSDGAPVTYAMVAEGFLPLRPERL